MSTRAKILLLLALVVVIDVAAFMIAPPFNKEDPTKACAFPVCFIEGNLELPAPHIVWRPGGDIHAAPNGLITFDVSVTSTIITMWVVSIFTIILLIALEIVLALAGGI